MKTLLSLMISGSLAVAAEPLTMKLDYKEGKEDDYAAQIQSDFTKLLTSDSALSKEFAKFEAPPPEDARGRYSGEPKIVPIVISEEEHVDFRDSGGKAGFEKVIALYYRFDEGVHRGRQTASGFFALFTVMGDLSYRHVENDDFDLSASSVIAKFQGFSRTLSAPQPDEQDQAEQGGTGQPATRSQSKSEGGDQPQPEAEGRSR
jgi:hypothetical protein